MQARDVMTTHVVSVTPDTPIRQIAALLLKHGISAAPVIGPNGVLTGIVSEGDLVNLTDEGGNTRRDWWLTLLAEGEELNEDFLKTIRRTPRVAHDVMVAPVVTTSETADVSDIARLLAKHRIKRVPVVRDGHVVGIVSRTDLLKALTGELV